MATSPKFTIVSWVRGPNEYTGEAASTLRTSTGDTTGPKIPGWKIEAIEAYQTKTFSSPLPVLSIPAYPKILSPEVSCCGQTPASSSPQPCKGQWVLVNALEDDTFPTQYGFVNTNPDWINPSNHAAGVYMNWIFGQYFCPGLQLGSSYAQCTTLCPRILQTTIDGETSTATFYFGLAIPSGGFVYEWTNVDTQSSPGFPVPLNFYYNGKVIFTIDGTTCNNVVVEAAVPTSGGYFGADNQPHMQYRGISTLIPKNAIQLTPNWSILPYTGPLLLDPNGNVDPVFEIHAFCTPSSTLFGYGEPYYFYTDAPQYDSGNSITSGWAGIQSGSFSPIEQVYPVGPLGVGGQFATSNQPFSNPWNETYSNSGDPVGMPGVFYSLNIHPPILTVT
jgi:hypothetical protein